MATVSGVTNAIANKGKNSLFPFTPSPMPPANLPKSGISYPLIIFTGILAAVMILMISFHDQIRQGWEFTVNSLRNSMGYPSNLTVSSEINPMSGDVKELTPEPTDLTHHSQKSESIVEKILPVPSDGKEVFNISENTYNYYDAEPLCKALGAELATYDQVKEAWQKGADWCNYGWVKGQMAVYPTQKGTYDALQEGPADGRGACGTVGLNGGHFDNPDLQYGVNCYGKKPAQIAPVDPGLPQTPGMVEFNKKVKEFAHDKPTELAPFNESKWSGRP